MERGKSAKNPNPLVYEEDMDPAEESRIFGILKTRLRLLEKDKEVRTGQYRRRIQRQEQEIKRLMAEQDELKKNLGMKNGGSIEQDQENMDGKLRELTNYLTQLDRELDVEANLQQKLKDQISDMEQNILDLKKGEMSPKGSKSRRRLMMTQRNLEDKLQNAMTQFNLRLSRNRELRSEVQDMLRGRACNQKILHAKKKELRELKEEIQEASKQSLTNYENCAHFHREMAALGVDPVQELLADNSQKNLQDFLLTKHEARDSLPEHTNTNTLEGKNTKETLGFQLDKIHHVAEETDMDQLGHGFIQVVGQNNELSKVVHEQTQEIKALQDEIVKTEEEMGQFQEQEEQRKLSHSATVEELSKQLEEVEAMTALYKDQARIKASTLRSVRVGLTSMCRTIGCHSEDEFSSYLEALELKTDEMLTIKGKEGLAEDNSKHV